MIMIRMIKKVLFLFLIFSIEVQAATLSFDGVNDLVNMGVPPALAITSNITLSAWVNVTAFPTSGNIGVFIEKGSDGATIESYMIRLRTPGGVQQLESGTFDGTNQYVQWSISGWSVNTWHFIVGRFDGTTWKVFFDGVEKQSLNSTVPPQSTSFRSTIGARDVNGTFSNFYNGLISNVRIFNRALSQREISEIYACADSPISTNTVGSWMLWESSGTFDLSQQSSSGTYVGNPVLVSETPPLNFCQGRLP